MAGTKTGGKAAAQTVKARYGDDWYTHIGRLGARAAIANGKPRGFAAMDPEKVRAAGSKGGRKSTREKEAYLEYTSPEAASE